MTEATLTRPALTPASALSAADLALLHADLPLGGPVLVETADLDAEALSFGEWGADGPMFPSRLVLDVP
jgi:hypothetical protein